MRFGSKSFSNSWNLYKKNHPNVHFLFPIRDKTKDALSQNTLPNPQQSLKPSSNFVNLPFEPWNTKLKVEIRSGARTQVKKWEIIGLELAKLKSVISSGDCGKNCICGRRLFWYFDTTLKYILLNPQEAN